MHAAIVFLPLIGCLIAGLLRKQIGARAAMYVTTGLLFVSAALSIVTFVDVAILGHEAQTVLFRWFAVGDFQASWTVRVDTLTAVMLVVVTGVSSLVHLYSIGYMDEDPDQARFFSYLSLFTFSMLALVTADDLLQMFFGWEGVGLASYLLIGFWYKKPSANAAAVKAFVTNRIGDFGFALGVMAAFATFGGIEFDAIFSAIANDAMITPIWASTAAPVSETTISFLSMEFAALELIGFLLFIGAMGKSAQFFLHVWLPDAMEGPTPVSALIHAATMVTAGVFLVCRMWPVYDAAPIASAFVTLIGAVTALYAATVGVAQNDIKRVVAYSTCSQLGYMFFAAGVGAYGAAMFHLFTHAFFKALLFLGSGAVIHGLHHEQDMRLMGGMRKKMPWTWSLMIIGTLALTGVGLPIGVGLGYGFAGFFSKDMIIESAFFAGQAGNQTGMLAFWMGVIAAFLTSFYSWRLIFMTFHGRYRGPRETFDHAHDAPWVMRAPLIVLAVGSVIAGAAFFSPFVGSTAAEFWRDSVHVEDHATTAAGHAPEAAHAPDEGEGEAGAVDQPDHVVPPLGAEEAEEAVAHHPPEWVRWAPFAVTAAGFLIAIWAYLLNEGLGARIAARGGPLHAFLYNKWYFDELYDAVLVRGARGLGDLFYKGGDQKVIDGLGPDGAAAAAAFIGRRQSKGQTGYLYHYAFVMLLGVAAFATWILFTASSGGAP